LCLFVVAFFPFDLKGNLRAPEISMQGPSSTIYGGGSGLVVAGVGLDFDCHIDRSDIPRDSMCDIVVHYRIVADSEITVNLQFIAPTEGDLHWKLGESSGTAAFVYETRTEDVPAALAELLNNKSFNSEADEEYHDWYSSLRWIYRAEFEVTLQDGEQLLEIRYQHPPGHIEYDYGYFRSSKFVHFVSYEIWPIKQWQLAEDFKMDFRVQICDAVSGFWSGLRGRAEGAVLLDESRERLVPDSSGNNEGDLRYEWIWNSDDLPDRITLFSGRSKRLNDTSKSIPGEHLLINQPSMD
jgi:hypothetical protein